MIVQLDVRKFHDADIVVVRRENGNWDVLKNKFASLAAGINDEQKADLVESTKKWLLPVRRAPRVYEIE